MVLIIVAVVVIVLVVTVVLAAILYVMVGGLVTGPGGGPPLVAFSRRDSAANFVLEVSSVSGSPSLATTTFVMRWPGNATIVVPPGQASLRSLETPSGGVQYLPATGTSQTEIRPSDQIVITKSGAYTPGMRVTIAVGSNVLWTGPL